MLLNGRSFRRAIVCTAGVLLAHGMAHAQAPSEVQNVAADAGGVLSWDAAAGTDFYNIYRASRSGSGAAGPLQCQAFEEGGTSYTPADTPADGEAYIYVVTAESSTGGEGPPGVDSLGGARYLAGACTQVMRNHIFNRLGFGWDEWTRDRMAAIGIDAYIAEQLDPTTISEAGNNQFITKLNLLTPPIDGIDMVGRHVIYATYARRHLEHKMAVFWANHFNTEYLKVLNFYLGEFPLSESQARRAAAGSLLRDFEDLRTLAFSGNFRDMLERASFGAPMLLYLDLVESVAGNPNENQPRELLELHSMGVDGGYTQLDVEELSKVMTGWTVCKHETADIGNPLAACIADPTQASPPGEWVAHFDISRHDCGPKTLFAGTPEQLVLPGSGTCNTVADANTALAEMDLALDAVTAHPSTATFICTKILELLVTDQPTPAMVNQLVTVWNDPGNPQGIGDLREVVREAVTMDAFMDPRLVGSKVKTPFEHFTGIMRSLRGATDGLTAVFGYLTEAQMLHFFNEVPTGYPERADEWMTTGGLLARQNFGIDITDNFPNSNFNTLPLQLLQDNGVSLSPNPNNAHGIVDFLSDALMGGRLTAAERQRAITFLNTNDAGVPFAYNDDRILDVVALLLGYPQYLEQ